MYDSQIPPLPTFENNYYSPSSDAAIGILAIFMIAILIVGALYAISSFLTMRIFKKAGLPAWKAWVPIYKNWIFLELGGYPGWIALLLVLSGGSFGISTDIGSLASLVALIVSAMAAFEISKKVGKKDLFVLYPLGIISLGITTLIWYIIVGSKDTFWQDNLGKPSLAKGTIIGYKTVKKDTPTEE